MLKLRLRCQQALLSHRLPVLLSSGVLLMGCASHKGMDPHAIDTTNYTQLSVLNADNISDSSTAANSIRIKAVGDTALQLGAQAGLAWRSAQINQEMDQQAKQLRTIFNFYPLMLEHGVLPPVLVEGSNTLNLQNGATIRIVDRTYEIVDNARFVTAPPTWRDYLITRFEKPELPNKTLLPKNAEEQELWQTNLKIGWENGVKQADTIYSENLARLKRDYAGMLLYRKLLAQHMVSPPYVAATDLGVTGDSNSMNIGDKVLRITALPALQADSHEWQSYVVKP